MIRATLLIVVAGMAAFGQATTVEVSVLPGSITSNAAGILIEQSGAKAWSFDSGNLVSIVVTGNVATVTTLPDHGLSTLDQVGTIGISVNGTIDNAINGNRHFSVTVTGLKTFTFPVAIGNSPASPGYAQPGAKVALSNIASFRIFYAEKGAGCPAAGDSFAWNDKTIAYGSTQKIGGSGSPLNTPFGATTLTALKQLETYCYTASTQNGAEWALNVGEFTTLADPDPSNQPIRPTPPDKSWIPTARPSACGTVATVSTCGGIQTALNTAAASAGCTDIKIQNGLTCSLANINMPNRAATVLDPAGNPTADWIHIQPDCLDIQRPPFGVRITPDWTVCRVTLQGTDELQFVTSGTDSGATAPNHYWWGAGIEFTTDPRTDGTTDTCNDCRNVVNVTATSPIVVTLNSAAGWFASAGTIKACFMGITGILEANGCFVVTTADGGLSWSLTGRNGTGTYTGGGVAASNPQAIRYVLDQNTGARDIVYEGIHLKGLDPPHKYQDAFQFGGERISIINSRISNMQEWWGTIATSVFPVSGIEAHAKVDLSTGYNAIINNYLSLTGIGVYQHNPTKAGVMSGSNYVVNRNYFKLENKWRIFNDFSTTPILINPERIDAEPAYNFYTTPQVWNFTSATNWVVTGVQHGYGNCQFSMWYSQAPAGIVPVRPTCNANAAPIVVNGVTLNQFDFLVQWELPQSGQITTIFSGFSGHLFFPLRQQLEFKADNNVEIIGNFFDGCWTTHAFPGQCINNPAASSDYALTYYGSNNYRIQYNTGVNTAGGFQSLCGQNYSNGTNDQFVVSRYNISHNLFTSYRPYVDLNAGSIRPGGQGISFAQGCTDWSVTHNTIFNPIGWQPYFMAFGSRRMIRDWMVDNLVGYTRDVNAGGMHENGELADPLPIDGIGTGLFSNSNTPTIWHSQFRRGAQQGDLDPATRFERNFHISGVRNGQSLNAISYNSSDPLVTITADSLCNPTTGTLAYFTKSQFCAAGATANDRYAATKFLNATPASSWLAATDLTVRAAMNYRLRHDSPWKRAGSDGMDPGVNVDLLEANQGKVINPRVIPTTITTDSATLAFTAPASDACYVDYGTSATWGTGTRVPDGFTPDSRAVADPDYNYQQPRVVPLLGLNNATTYHVRVLCPSEQYALSFTTH